VPSRKGRRRGGSGTGPRDPLMEIGVEGEEEAGAARLIARPFAG
jgi:hypothetical protein